MGAVSLVGELPLYVPHYTLQCMLISYFSYRLDNGMNAFMEGQTVDLMPTVNFPYDEWAWCIIFTRNFLSQLQLSCEGASTALYVCDVNGVDSGLVVILAKPKRSLDYITAFTEDFNVFESNIGSFDYEVVFMNPRDML